MRGSAAAHSAYATQPSVKEQALAILELNANAGVSYDFAGYYMSTANNTYTESGNDVVGAFFTTRYVKTFSPIIGGSTDTDIPELRYVDEPDARYEEEFPIDSIFGLNRPGPGIVKMTADDNLAPIPSPYARLYACDSKSPYKYWKSAPYDGVWRSSPFIKYARSFWANKLKITVETHRDYNGAARTKPLQYSVQLLIGDEASSGTWTTVYSSGNAPWPDDGTLRLYYYDGVWTTTPSIMDIHEFNAPSITNAVKIFGVRVHVTQGPTNAGLSFIEISPRLSLNVTNAMLSCSSIENLSESDSALPVGTISANSSEVRLDNYDGLLNFDTWGSVMYGHQPKKSNLDIYAAVETSPNVFDVSRISYGIVDEVLPSDDSTITYKCYDGMNYLQTTPARGIFLKDYRVSDVVRALLDYAGVSEMNFNYETITDDLTIPFYYVNDGSVYDALADIAEAYQMAMHFDSDNVFQLYTKEYLMSTARATVAQLRYDDSGSNLANIISIDETQGKPVNNISISYKHHYLETGLKAIDRGDPATGRPWKPLWWQRREPKTSVVWESDPAVLAAAGLVNTLLPADNVMYIDQEAGAGFNYSGYAMIGSEVIAYDAKEYFYRPFSSGTYVTVWVSSEEEYNSLQNTMYPGSRLYFTGKLRIPANGRGKFRTTARTHYVDPTTSYPYTRSGACASWKTCPQITAASYTPKYPDGTAYGSATWRFKSGDVTNLRGVRNAPGSVVRRGSNSAIRMNGPSKEDLDGRTSSSVWDAITHSAVWYLDTVSNEIIPKRVGAGIALVGRSDLKAPYRPEARAGVGMWMWHRAADSGRRLNGWTVEIVPNREAGENVDNVRIYQVIDDVFNLKASGTAPVPFRSHTVVPASRRTDDHYTHVELAYYSSYNGAAYMFAYVNGVYVCKAKIDQPENLKMTGAHGPYVRSRTMADVDYVWWSTRANPEVVDGYTADSPVDWTKFTIRDAILSASGPPIWWSEGTKQLFGDDINTSNLTSSSETMGLAEFGPMVHEVEVIRTDFSEAPVLNPSPVGSFGSGAKAPSFSANPFGAEMVVVNARRHAVVLDDNARISIKGYPVKMLDQTFTLDDLAFSGDDDAEVARAKGRASKTIHGDIAIEIASDLIQSKFVAKSLMKWILDAQALDCDILEVEIFGNPLLEVGDLVSVDYPELNIPPTRKYLVVEINNSFDRGFSTSLKLRRLPQ